MSAKKKSQAKETTTPAINDFIVSVKEATAFLGISDTTLKRDANRGVIPSRKRGYGEKKRYKFRWEDLKEHKANMDEDPTGEPVPDIDRQTNPMVAEAIEQRPDVFKGWSKQKKDILFGQFAKGGALTVEGVIELAIEENETDEIRRQFEIVIRNRNHRASLASIIGTMYKSTAIKPRR